MDHVLLFPSAQHSRELTLLNTLLKKMMEVGSVRPCVPLRVLFFPDLSQPALLSIEQKHGWRRHMHDTNCSERVNFPFSCAVTTKRSSKKTAGDAEELLLFRDTIGQWNWNRHSKRGSRFRSRWPRADGSTYGSVPARSTIMSRWKSALRIYCDQYLEYSCIEMLSIGDDRCGSRGFIRWLIMR